MSIHALTRYVKPADLRYDGKSGLWTYNALILGRRIPFAGIGREHLCDVINDNIRLHTDAHNRGTTVDAHFLAELAAARRTLTVGQKLRSALRGCFRRTQKFDR